VQFWRLCFLDNTLIGLAKQSGKDLRDEGESSDEKLPGKPIGNIRRWAPPTIASRTALTAERRSSARAAFGFCQWDHIADMIPLAVGRVA